MPHWTEEQQSAIDAREKTLLVSAAAGSGKTAVLVERILRLTLEGARMDRMLIVTFTKAAAAEMRERLKRKLDEALLLSTPEDREKLRQAAEDVEAAQISTIHSFCQDLLRQEFDKVGIDPEFAVADEQDSEELFDRAYRQVMNTLLGGEGSTSFAALTDAFTVDELRKMTYTLYTYAVSTEDPRGWLREKAELCRATGSLQSHPWMQALIEDAMLEAEGLQEVTARQREMLALPDAVPDYAPLYEADLAAVKPLFSPGSAESFLDALRRVAFGRAPGCRGLSDGQKAWKDEYNALRDTLKKHISEITARLCADPERTERELQKTGELLTGLRELTEQVWQAFEALKRDRNLVDFSDMEQYTLRLLNDPDCCAAVSRRYEWLFVDECQDVSRVQDAIFQRLHSAENSLFMVGDVKQSIYRFRLADPTLFLSRVRAYQKAEGAAERKIVLNANFRSARPVLAAANAVFRAAMKRRVTEIDYTEDDELVYGRPDAEAAPVEVLLLSSGEDGDAAAALEAECAAVGQRIRELLGQPILTGSGEKPIEYRDICILMSAVNTNGEQVKKLLEKQGIPVFFDGKETYYDLPEIRSMKALLELMDDPLLDIPLLSVLRQPPFGFTSRELTAIRAMKSGGNESFRSAFDFACTQSTPLGRRCLQAQDTMKEWRFRSDSLPLSDYLWYLMRETGLYARAAALPGAEVRRANLRLLAQKAADYEQGGGATLSGFVRRMNLEVSTGDNTTAKVLGEQENVVRVMTMHKSKGLEFPVVFLLRLGTALRKASQGGVLCQEKLGYCVPYVNTELSIRRDNLGTLAIRGRKGAEELAERCRLLYVAMTRARERLILVGALGKNTNTGSWFLPDSEWRVSQARSMLDWVMQAVCDELGLDRVPEKEVANETWRVTPRLFAPVTEAARAGREQELADWLQAAQESTLSSPAPWWDTAEAALPPLKTSVSSLIRRSVLGDPLPPQEEETAETKREPETIAQPLRLSEIPSRPAFLEEKQLSAAEKGTATHRFLSIVPLQPLRMAERGAYLPLLREELRRSEAEGLLSREEAQAIRLEQVNGWFAGDLGQRFLRAEEARREWPFNLKLSGGTLLQGVIDCAFREADGWVLCDYKTDFIEDEQAFRQRHAGQLRWYQRAVEALTGIPVKEMWLWSLRLSKGFSVEKE